MTPRGSAVGSGRAFIRRFGRWIYRPKRPEPPAHEPRRIRIKDWLGALQSAFTIAAIIAAGWWFLTQRQNKPRIRIEQSVSQHAAIGDPGSILLAVDVRVTNIGNVIVDLDDGRLQVGDISPALRQLKADSIDPASLEPGETAQMYFKTFLVANRERVLEVATHFGAASHDETWDFTSVFDVGPNTRERRTATIADAPR